MKKSILLTAALAAACLLLSASGCGKGDDEKTTKVITSDGSTVTPTGKPKPTAVCHLLICCRSNNKGTKFLVNGEWNASHDYRDISQVRDIMQKIKEAGVNVVSVDFTNPPEWEGADGGKIHIDGQSDGLNWAGYGKMLDNIVKVCKEKNMQFMIFIGNPAAWGMAYWNQVAGFIYDKYAKDNTYRKYGNGDDRPILPVFLPGETFDILWKNADPADKKNLEKFHIGTCQVNDPIREMPTDGWGYRNQSGSSDGKVRFVSPNSGVAPSSWARVDADGWKQRVEWGLKAKDYVVLGSYDDTCDAIFWGVADVSKSQTACHKNAKTVDKPSIYYDIVKEALTGGK